MSGDWNTCDLSDAHPEARLLAPLYRDFGGSRRFCGPVATVKVFEDNALVRQCLEGPGEGRVLVVDGGGSLRCALVGGLLGELALAQGWAGLLVHGCVRDSRELAALPLGIKALAAHPRKSEKGLHGGRTQVLVHFAETHIAPGDWLYADADGVLLAEGRLHLG